MIKEYRMMIALLKFKAAFHELAAASQELPDLDVSEGYPFYLLDYEVIAPAVEQWCNIQATRLAQQLPDEVDNPACTQCEYFKAGIGASGLCKGNRLCSQYPTIVFTEQQARVFLKSVGVAADQITDINVLRVTYLQKMEEIYEQRKTEGLISTT